MRKNPHIKIDNMAYRILNKISARSIVADYEDNNECIIDSSSLTTEEKELRHKFARHFAVKKELQSEDDFPLGMLLYTDWLSCGDKIDLRIASDDGFWRNLTCRVVPDYVFRRWPSKMNPEGSLKWNLERFYAKPQRNWLKIIWWMCHLSWQGDEYSTKNSLDKLGSDPMSQVVERTGRGGYNVDLYRQIIAHATSDKHPLKMDIKGAIRRAMRVHTLRVKTVIPEFHKDGLDGYVNSLFNSES